MEHKNLDLEFDNNLINKILDNIENRYIILFLYVIRNDLLQDLTNNDLIEKYEKILALDDIYKENIVSLWTKEFIEIAIDLGLFKNIRSVKEFEQKDKDFIVKLGEETVTIESKSILVPEDTLFRIISKKFKFLLRRDFNSALIRLKSVMCEKTSVIHSLIYQIDDHDYTLSDDIYYILDEFGNIYQTIKIELTVEQFYERFKEIKKKLEQYLEIYDPQLNNKSSIKKISKALEEKKDVIQYLKDQKVKLSEKFNWEDIDRNVQIFKDWNENLNKILKFRNEIEGIDNKLLEIKSIYSGKKKKYSYLEFIEKISFNEDNIVNKIQNSLIQLRKEIIEINNYVSQLNIKDVKLLNLDFERFLLTM